MSVVKWFVLAIQFLTVVPTPAIGDVTDHDVRRSVLFFPVVGGMLGTFLWVVQRYLTVHLFPLSATAISLALYTFATGALHLDGVMDTADAIGSRRRRDQALAIMKDSRIGAMGAVVGVLLLIGKFAAISSLPPQHYAPFVVVPMLSRLAMIWSMAISPSARPDGLGPLFARSVPLWVVIATSTFSVAVCALTLPAVACVWAVLYTVVLITGFTIYMRRKFGGTTGDTYGALNELMEWVGWLVFAAIYH